MDSEITEIVPPSPAPSPTPAADYEQCGECGAPVDHEQRYCVSCGAHRAHVADPAARYLGQSGAETGASASSRRRPRWTFGLAHALLLALIPVALAVGVVVGRSSNNDDAGLIRALSHSQTQASAAGSTNTASASTATGSARTRHKRTSGKHSTKHSSANTQASYTHSKAPTDVDATPTAAQQKQGKAIVDKLQHTTGTSFLNQLPSQVSVP